MSPTVQLRDLASVNRRLAITVIGQHAAQFRALAQHETNQYHLAWAIDRAVQISPLFGTMLAAEFCPKVLLMQVQQERHRFNLAARALLTYARLQPVLLAPVLRELDYISLFRRIEWRKFLPNFVALMSGLIETMWRCWEDSEQQVEKLVETVLDDAQIAGRLREAVTEADKLSEIAVAYSELSRIGLSLGTINRLLMNANDAELDARIRDWIKLPSDVVGYHDFLFAMGALGRYFGELAAQGIIEVARDRQTATHGRFPLDRRGHSGRQGIMPVGMEINDVPTLGHLLRLIGAIDERLASQFAGALDMERFAIYCANEQNVGAQVSLLFGLHEASYKRYLNLVSNLYGESGDKSAQVKLLKESSKSDNIIALVRQLQLTALPTSRHLLALVMANCSDLIAADLEVGTNLAAASRWARTLYTYQNAQSSNGVVSAEYFELTLTTIFDTARFDERLYGSVEAALALIEVGRAEDGVEFAEAAVAQAEQIRGVGNAVDLCRLMLRLLRIEQGSKAKDMVDRVFAKLPDAMFGRLMVCDRTLVASAFIHYLCWKHVSALGIRYQTTLKLSRATLFSRLRDSSMHPVIVLVSEILLGATSEMIARTVSAMSADNPRIGSLRPWEIGLVETVYNAVRGTDGIDTFSRHLSMGQLDAEQELRRLRSFNGLWGRISEI